LISDDEEGKSGEATEEEAREKISVLWEYWDT